MQGRLTAKPVEEVISAIQALDLESVKKRVMDPELGEGWSREYADSIEVAYKNYLTMLVKYQDDAENIMLSKDVDEFWHTHILQTMKYADDCQKVFGTFLHHDPHIGELTEEDLARRVEKVEKTKRLYQQEFGDSHRSALAWAGGAGIQNAAFSNATIGQGASFSNAEVMSEAAAFSNVDAAFSNAGIQADRVAFSNATIGKTFAGSSDATVKGGEVAFSNATIAKGSAFSNATVQARTVASSHTGLEA